MVHPLVLTDQRILTPFPVCIHNLNHVSLFPLKLPFACLACLCAGLCSRTLVLVSPLTLLGVLTYQHT